MDGNVVSQTDTESESDISERSVSASLPQNWFSSRTYAVDDKVFFESEKKRVLSRNNAVY